MNKNKRNRPKNNCNEKIKWKTLREKNIMNRTKRLREKNNSFAFCCAVHWPNSVCARCTEQKTVGVRVREWIVKYKTNGDCSISDHLAGDLCRFQTFFNDFRHISRNSTAMRKCHEKIWFKKWKCDWVLHRGQQASCSRGLSGSGNGKTIVTIPKIVSAAKKFHARFIFNFFRIQNAKETKLLNFDLNEKSFKCEKERQGRTK